MNRQRHRRLHIGTGIFGTTILFVGGLNQFMIFVSVLIHVWFSSFPDIDQKIFFLDHRGITHTLLFTLVLGGLCYLSLMSLYSTIESNTSLMIKNETRWSLIISGSIVLSSIQHILEDILTVGGGFVVRPLWPIRTSLSLTDLRSDSRWFSLFVIFILLISVMGSIIVLHLFDIIDLSQFGKTVNYK